MPLATIRERRRLNQLDARRPPVVDDVFEHHVADFERPSADEQSIRFSPEIDLEQWLDDHFGPG